MSVAWRSGFSPAAHSLVHKVINSGTSRCSRPNRAQSLSNTVPVMALPSRSYVAALND